MRKAYNLFFTLAARLLPDKVVEYFYVKRGAEYGDAASYISIAGECLGFENRRLRWERWEKEYTRRGYQAVPLEEFIGYGGYGKKLQSLGIKKKEERS